MEVETGEVKEHPTYKRIQEYVQEKYGFKVHTAYIAEVKRMVGLDMHKAPNAVEQRKHEYHPCPPEKVEAIKDALRQFWLNIRVSLRLKAQHHVKRRGAGLILSCVWAFWG